ncbi:MAG TPA: sugar-binding domain-containing protein, partial [Pyrinomonadaceae bacterium]
MKKFSGFSFVVFSLLLFPLLQVIANPRPGNTLNFNQSWRFHLGDVANGQAPDLDDAQWRLLDLPHDWSIEGEFSEKHPAGFDGGALPGGIGWYRKTFNLPLAAKGKSVFVDFDGIYRNSEVWINGHYLGKRPYGYISFQYELSPYLDFGNKKNVIAVKVDNSQQPNSRWYSGSGIYRNVWLTTVEQLHVDHWGTYITTPQLNETAASVEIETIVRNSSEASRSFKLKTILYDARGKEIARAESTRDLEKGAVAKVQEKLAVGHPLLWSIDNPYLYKAVSQVE